MGAQKLRTDQVSELPRSIQADALKRIPVKAFEPWEESLSNNGEVH